MAVLSAAPPAGLSYVEIAAGNSSTVARLSDGSVVAWGANDFDQCNVPAPPAGFTYVEVAAGGAHTVFRLGPSFGTSYCTAGTTTNGCLPSISGTGTPSGSVPSGFTIAVTSVEGQKQGLLFYGVDNSGFTPLAWGAGSSFLCIKAPQQRTAAMNSGGTLNACDGVLSLDWNAFRASNPSALGQPFAAGKHVYAQGWFRDPPAPKTTNLSDALEFVVQP